MLEYEFWGNTIENWGISGIIIVVTVILAKLISYLNKKVLIPYTKKTRNKLDEIIINSIEAPIVFAVVQVGLWMAIHR